MGNGYRLINIQLINAFPEITLGTRSPSMNRDFSRHTHTHSLRCKLHFDGCLVAILVSYLHLAVFLSTLHQDFGHIKCRWHRSPYLPDVRPNWPCSSCYCLAATECLPTNRNSSAATNSTTVRVSRATALGSFRMCGECAAA